MSTGLRVALLLAGVLWSSLARATPPDVDDARLRPLCAGPGGVAWSATVRGHGGSHYLRIIRWGLVWVEPEAGQVSFVSMGGMTENHIDVDLSAEGPHDPEVTWQPVAVDQAGVLRDWGARRCDLPDRLRTYRPEPVAFHLSFHAPASWTLVLGDQSKAIDLRVVDIRNRASDYGDPVGTLAFDALAPFELFVCRAPWLHSSASRLCPAWAERSIRTPASTPSAATLRWWLRGPASSDALLRV